MSEVQNRIHYIGPLELNLISKIILDIGTADLDGTLWIISSSPYQGGRRGESNSRHT